MDNFKPLLNKAYRFLSYRSRSEKEIRDYLEKKSKKLKFDSEENKNLIIEKAVEKLKEQKFLDDFEFTRQWINSRNKIKPKSIKFIFYELKQKGITREMAEEVLQDDSVELISDLEKAMALAEKKIVRYKNDDPEKIYIKLARFLAYKGFDYTTIKRVIDQKISKRYNKRSSFLKR